MNHGLLSGPWRGIYAFLGALLYVALAALPIWRVVREPDSEDARAAVAPLLVAAHLFAALAVSLELDLPWPGVAGVAAGLTVPGLTFAGVRLSSPGLRRLAGSLAVASWLLLLFGRDLEVAGTHGLLLSALALALASVLARSDGAVGLAGLFEGMTLVLAVFVANGFLSLLGVDDAGMTPAPWILVGGAALALSRSTGSAVLRWGGALLMICGASAPFLLALIFRVPALWTQAALWTALVACLLMILTVRRAKGPA